MDVPLVLMNSFNTDDDTQKLLKKVIYSRLLFPYFYFYLYFSTQIFVSMFNRKSIKHETEIAFHPFPKKILDLHSRDIRD